jgi:chitosanase
MDIRGLGPQTIEKMLDLALISDAADLYSLNRETLVRVPNFKEKSIQNLLASVAASKTKAFRDAQDAVVDHEYFRPAMRAADDLGLTTALARAQLYDAAIQHGDGEDADGLSAMIDRTNARVGTPQHAGEEQWLDAFFETRTATLEHPADKKTAKAWRESVDRVRCMRSIADAGNFDLHGPIECVVYGDKFTIR